MISGFVINVGMVLITKILTPSNFKEYSTWLEDYNEYNTMPFACLSLYIGGLLCLSIASSYKVTRGLVLFLFSFAIMGSTIFCLYQSVQIYDRAFNQGNLLWGIDNCLGKVLYMSFWLLSHLTYLKLTKVL